MFHVKHLPAPQSPTNRRFHVKHLGDREAALLTSLLEEAGLVIPKQPLELMLEHLDWVLEANRSLNLTAITDPTDGVRLHIVDSLLALESVNGAPSGSMVDLGTGAGFPGIPIGLASGRSTLLVDSVKKKTRTVETFINTLPQAWSARFSVSALRAEELAQSQPASFEVVTARAVSRLGSLVELAAPLLRPRGQLVALKGRMEKEELLSAQRTASIVGLEVTEVREQLLPGGEEVRTVVSVVRVSRSAVPLPRRTGLAQRQPLC